MKNKFWNFVDNGDSAELQLFGTISSEEDWWSEDCVTYRDFIAELKALGKKTNINVLINSGGGDVFAANAIYTALVTNGAKITATVIGLCASAATIVLQAACKRRIAKNGVVMAHNPKVTLYGSYGSEDLVKLADVTDKVKESIMSVYRDRLGKTDDEITELMNNESWYVGQEAVDNGFCDEVIDETVTNSITNENVMTVNGIGYSFSNYVNNFVPDDIRKKVQDLSKTPQKEDGTFSNTTNNKNPKKGNENMGATAQNAAPTITDAASLRTAYPDFVNEIVENAIQAERNRMKAIDSIANGIPDDVLAKAKYEEPVTAEALAFAQMQANSSAGQKAINDLKDDLQNSGVAGVNTVPNAGNNAGEKTPEEKEAKISGFANALNSDKRRGRK